MCRQLKSADEIFWWNIFDQNPNVRRLAGEFDVDRVIHAVNYLAMENVKNCDEQNPIWPGEKPGKPGTTEKDPDRDEETTIPVVQ